MLWGVNILTFNMDNLSDDDWQCPMITIITIAIPCKGNGLENQMKEPSDVHIHGT